MAPSRYRARLVERLLDLVTQRQVCSNRRRKRASGAVRVRSRSAGRCSSNMPVGRAHHVHRSGPSRWPPLTTTTRGPRARIRLAAARMSSSDRIVVSARTSASGMFGVTTSATSEQLGFHRCDGFLDEQSIAALRDHHGIDDYVAADPALQSQPPRPRRWRRWPACPSSPRARRCHRLRPRSARRRGRSTPAPSR